MEGIDNEKAKRVWQRVQGTAAPPPDIGCDIRELVKGEMEAAAAYLQLSRRLQGKDSAALRQMAEEERSHAAALKGICAMYNGTRPGAPTPTPQTGPIEVLLRRYYGGELKSVAEYERRSADPQYGMVFRQMAEEEKTHCRHLLELLGRLEQKPKRA